MIPTHVNERGELARPHDDIDPELKQNKPDWSLQWAKFMYDEFRRGKTAITPQDIERFNENMAYAEGRQDTTKYKNAFLTDDVEDQPSLPVVNEESGKHIDTLRANKIGLQHIDFDTVYSPIPHYISSIIGKMESQDHDVVIEATDELSGTFREQLKMKKLIKKDFQNKFQTWDQMMGITTRERPEPLPDSLDELNLFEQVGHFKLASEIAIETALQHIKTLSRNARIKRRLITSLAVNGYAAVYDYEDNDGLSRYEYQDVREVIMEDSRHPDYHDATYAGVLRYFSIPELRERTGWKEDKIRSLARTHKGYYGNTYNIDEQPKADGSYTYDGYRIPVLLGFVKTADTTYETKRKGKPSVYEPYGRDKKGRSKKPKQYDTENRKTEPTSVRTLYQFYWPVGCDEVFDYGKVFNIPFHYEKRDVELPVHLAKIDGRPIVEAMKPIEDQIQFTYYDLQNARAKAAPPGLAIELGSLEEITLNGKNFKPKDIIKLRQTSGNYFYKSVSPTMDPMSTGSQAVPFQELQGGMGNVLQEIIQRFELFFRQLSNITGIDEYSIGGQTPNKETGKGVLELTMANTQDMLKPIYSAYIDIKEMVNTSLACRVQAEVLSVDDIKESVYYKILGEAKLHALHAAMEFPPASYGLQVVAKPTQQEKQAMIDAAQAATAGGKNGIPALTWSEYLFVVRSLNSQLSIKAMEVYLAKKEQEREKQERQHQMASIEKQEEEQRKTAKQKADQEQISANAERDKELAVVQAEQERDESVARVKGEEERKTLKLKMEGEKQDQGFSIE